jgi:hypothetical protein
MWDIMLLNGAAGPDDGLWGLNGWKARPLSGSAAGGNRRAARRRRAALRCGGDGRNGPGGEGDRRDEGGRGVTNGALAPLGVAAG